MHVSPLKSSSHPFVIFSFIFSHCDKNIWENRLRNGRISFGSQFHLWSAGSVTRIWGQPELGDDPCYIMILALRYSLRWFNEGTEWQKVVDLQLLYWIISTIALLTRTVHLEMVKCVESRKSQVGFSFLVLEFEGVGAVIGLLPFKC